MFLKACAELALANSTQIGIKYLIFQKMIFYCKFRSTAPSLEFLHLGNLLKPRNLRKCIMESHTASVDGIVEHPNNYESAASLERHTQLAFENDMLHLRRQQSNTW